MNKTNFFIISAGFNLIGIVIIFILFGYYQIHERFMYQIFGVPNFQCLYDTKIVMVGDSLVKGTRWNRLLGRNDTVNLGVNGGTTDTVIRQLDKVYKLKPELCFIMVGINDLYWGNSNGSKTPAEVLKNYKIIIEGLKQNKILPVVQSVLYVGPTVNFPIEQNNNVYRLNQLLVEYITVNQIVYLDLKDAFSKGRFLNMKFSDDGIHLNNDGYEQWKQKLIPLIYQLRK